MEVEVRLGESDRVQQYVLPAENKFAYLQEQLRKEGKIDPNDQLLIGKSGILVNSQEQLTRIQSQTTHAYREVGGNKIQQKYCIYAYNLKALRTQQSLKNFSEAECQQTLEQRLNTTASLKSKSQFKSLQQIYSREELSKLQLINPNLMDCAACLFQTYDNLGEESHKLQQIFILNEELESRCQIQSKAKDIVWKMLTERYKSLLKNKPQDIQSRLNEYSAEFQHWVGSIEQLRHQPIHPKVQSQTNTSLYDLYYEFEEQKKTLRSRFVAAQRRLDSYKGQYRQLQLKNEKIKEDSKVLKQKIKASNLQLAGCPTKIEQFRIQAQMVIRVTKQKCSKLRQAIIQHLNRPDDPDIMRQISNICNIVLSEEKQYSEKLAKLQEYIEVMKKYYVGYNKCIKVQQNYVRTAFHMFQSNTERTRPMEIELKKILGQLNNLQSDIRSQPTSEELRKGCEISLREASRRRSFYNKIEQMYKNIATMLEEEQQKRKMYINNRRKIKLKQFIPKLHQYVVPTITLDAKNDSSLPLIFAQEEDIGEKSQRKEQDLRKENQRLKQKIQKYEKNSENSEYVLKALDDITTINTEAHSYRKMKENMMPNSPQINKWEARVNNLEDLLRKSTKICHQIYRIKLKQQTKRLEESNASLCNQICQLKQSLLQSQIINRKLKQELISRDSSVDIRTELHQLKKRSKAQIGQLEKNFVDQIKGLNSEIGKLKEENAKKEQQLRAQMGEFRQLQKHIKLTMQEKRHYQEQTKQLKALQDNAKRQIETLRSEIRSLKKQLYHSEKQRQKCLAELVEHRSSLADSSYESEKLSRLEKENSQIRQIYEQVQIQLKCKEANLQAKILTEKLTIDSLTRRIQDLQTQISHMNDNLQAQRQISMQVKMLLGDKQIQLMEKDQTIRRLQQSQKSERSSNEDEENMANQILQLKQEKQRLTQQLQNAQNQLQLIILKQTYEIQTQTDECSLDDTDKVDISQVKRGKKMLFIPFSTGVYLPVSMVDSFKTQKGFYNTTISSYKNNYFLDMGSLDTRSRDFLNQCSLVMISKVENVRQRIATPEDNPYNLKMNQRYYLVEVEKPDYIVGFQDQDISIKNYAFN